MQGIEFNNDWKFYLGEPEAPHLNETIDEHWRKVHLPHDWSVEFSFDGELGEACTGFLLGGIGWYRKHFITEKSMLNEIVKVNFDGVYNRATIYCNGEVIDFHPYGYSPLLVDITKYLNPVGEDNVIAVKVDRSRYADSRWYTGSGIYRKVSMYVLPKVHIPVWGIQIFTKEIQNNIACLTGSIQLDNQTENHVNCKKVITIVDEFGAEKYREVINTTLTENEKKQVEFHAKLENPILWEVHNGHCYKLIVENWSNDILLQKCEETFGVRTIKFDPNTGFWLNDKSTLIKGVCLHHEAGLVGAAVPKDVWIRRLKLLKDCGCNAIRTAHNPASEDFLNLCDEMGFLVQEEFFDEWDNPKDKRRNNHERTVDYITRAYTEFFRDYAKSDLQNTVKRDINHPCIIQWSIGNEIEWTYPKYNVATGFFGEDAIGYAFWKMPPYTRDEIRDRVRKIPKDYYDVGSTASKLSQWTKEIDKSRPVIANCILPEVSFEDGCVDALDMVGFSYRKVVNEYCHKHYPDKPIMGTENKPQWHEWKEVLEKDYISGVFLWTGIDHMGEAWVQKPWPRKGSNLGLLDLAGFKKPPYHMFKSLWQEEPHIKMYTQYLEKSLYQLSPEGELEEKLKDGWKRRSWFWQEVNDHWNYESDELIVVEIYSNCDSIELFLNDQSLGKKYLVDFADRICKWIVPYNKGELVAKGIKNNEEVTDTLSTSGEITAIEITTDKECITLSSDSVAHITLQLKDEKGYDIRFQDARVTFQCLGNYKILGVDNGHPDNVEDFQNDTIQTSEGRCLMIVQGAQKGQIKIQAVIKEKGLRSNEVIVKVE